MRYDIRLSIAYHYGSSSDRARTIVRLLPSDLPGHQIVSSRLLTVDPLPYERHDSMDFFGNSMTTLGFRAPIDRITYSLKATAERLSNSSELDLSSGLSDLSDEVEATRSLSPRSPHHFVGPSPRVPPDSAISAFARSTVQPSMTVLEIVRSIGSALHREMRFDALATDVNTTPSEAFANRHGVCQDFSHVMIAALRAIGIPAGYVSGFLRTIPPEGQERLEGADAMHAWIMAWCGAKTGWIEYDPTNDCMVAQDHVVVAYGRDYCDVSPVKGVLRTSGTHSSQQMVDVLPL